MDQGQNVNLNLGTRLEELEETLRAIRNGEVDALVVSGRRGERIYTLKNADGAYRVLIETMNEGTVTVSKDGTILYCNGRMAEMLKLRTSKIMGTEMQEFIREKEVASFNALLKKGRKGNCKGEVVLKAKNRTVPVRLSLSPVRTNGLDCIIVVITDLTEQKAIEEALRKASEDLEAQVQERTAQLKEREKDLEIKSQSLEESNIALKVLLRRRDEDKQEIERKILLSIKELVVPYMEKFRVLSPDRRQKAYLDVMESNLNQIISSFSRKLSSEFLKLTSTEIRVANLLMQDRTTKDISELLNSTPRAIAFHRSNIRKKLGIVNKKTNLKAYLSSLEK